LFYRVRFKLILCHLVFPALQELDNCSRIAGRCSSKKYHSIKQGDIK